MKIAILHLTDLHFRGSDNIISNRVEKIHTALRLNLSDVKKIYIVVTGDIVERGEESGYIYAKKFLLNLKDLFDQSLSNTEVKFIIIPGNHDCNFEYDTTLRRNNIKSMNYDTIGDEDNSVIDLCMEVQKDFWDFYSYFNELPSNKLFFQILDEIDNKKICFNCFNTSWMSQKREVINLFFPVRKFDNTKKLDKGDLNFSILHHPIVWFKPEGENNNRKELQSFIENNSSIILYGHEHEEEHKKSVELWSQRETMYFSGKILQDNKEGENSGFQLVTININDKKGWLKQYLWKKDLYISEKTRTFKLNGEVYGNKKYKPNSDYINKLNTIKIPIKIENITDVKLSDFYVFPDLEKNDFENDDMESFYNAENLISGKDFNKCIIEGENQSGKSSLIAMLYKKFIEIDKYPLIVDCKSFKTPDVDKVLKKAFNEQYVNKKNDFERYIQDDKTKKVLLIDDLQNLKFNHKTIKGIIENLEKRFNKIIIVTSKLYGLLSKIETEFDDLEFFSLRPLGYKKRNKLIENYHRLSLSETKDTDETLLNRTKNSFDQVEAVLGNKLMPSYPVFVLSILQTLVYAKTTNFEQTSYGYCYHSLINIALARKAQVPNEYIDTYFNFLSEFSLYLYKEDKYTFSENELLEFFKRYEKEYHVGFSFDRLKRGLIESKLIIIQHDDWKFSYEYIFYFLVARKLSELIGKKEGKDAIKYLCSNLHKEKNANILLFVAHHTKDDFLIEEATFTAMVPFEDITPITLNRDGEYYDLIKDIVKEISSDIIEDSSDPVKTRDEMLESQDDVERRKEREKNKNENEDEDEDESLNHFMSPFFQSYRALEIVGQIIKNRKGSIPQNQLIEMIAELYNTAFRSISFFGNTLSETKEDFIETLKSKIDVDDSNHNVEEKVNSFFQFISLQICLGVFGKVIHSVGQKDLRKLFDETAEKIGTPAADIVTFSINTSYGNMSTGDLKSIVKKYEKNPVAMQIIKSRVKSYLYQNYVSYKKRQSFADTLNMRIKPSQR